MNIEKALENLVLDIEKDLKEHLIDDSNFEIHIRSYVRSLRMLIGLVTPAYGTRDPRIMVKDQFSERRES